MGQHRCQHKAWRRVPPYALQRRTPICTPALPLRVIVGISAGMFDPQTVPVTQDILLLVARIDAFRGMWRAFGTLAPERLSALLRVATIKSIGPSTRI